MVVVEFDTGSVYGFGIGVRFRDRDRGVGKV